MMYGARTAFENRSHLLGALMTAVTGAANIPFLLLVCSGLYIWWPKRLSKATFRTAAVFNPKLGGKARDFNWHSRLASLDRLHSASTENEFDSGGPAFSICSNGIGIARGGTTCSMHRPLPIGLT